MTQENRTKIQPVIWSVGLILTGIVAAGAPRVFLLAPGITCDAAAIAERLCRLNYLSFSFRLIVGLVFTYALAAYQVRNWGS